MQSLMSGLKPYSSPSHLTDMSFDTDTLTNEVALKAESRLEGWEG